MRCLGSFSAAKDNTRLRATFCATRTINFSFSNYLRNCLCSVVQRVVLSFAIPYLDVLSNGDFLVSPVINYRLETVFRVTSVIFVG